MRETPNIKLTQFEPNDVPNWLDQYNSDMVKVDTAVGEQKTENSKYELRFTADEELINNNRTQISENTQDIANVKDDIKNIKGGSTTSIASLQTEVTEVSHSLTTLKGGSDRTIAELENDLNTNKAEISTLDGRVNRIDNTLGTESVANFGNDVTTAIGNVDLGISTDKLSVSEVLNRSINGKGSLTFDKGKIESLGGSASIDFAKNSTVCVPALLNMKIDAVGGTLNAGTYVLFTAPLARLPKLKPNSFIFLFTVSDVIGMTESASTAERVNVYIRTTATMFDIIIAISKGQWVFKSINTPNYVFPVVLPVNPF